MTSPLASHASEVPVLKGGALAGERPRVIVSTDIGGHDPDDFQSMVHYLVYADVFDTEGLISSPPGPGRSTDLHFVLDAYAKDEATLRRHSPRYPSTESLRAMVKQGALDPAPESGFSQPTEGSNWIIQRAHAQDSRPLWILGWGSITDLAQALHDDPSIEPKLRVYYIGAWNTRQDPAARRYIYEHHPKLWWIEADTTFRGMYVGGKQGGDLGNDSFVEQHVKPAGALGQLLYQAKPDIKMGDTPSVLYLLSGDIDDPTSDSWGGRFVISDPARPTHWTDDPDPAFRSRDYNGAQHVNRWRQNYLRHWQQRMARLLP